MTEVTPINGAQMAFMMGRGMNLGQCFEAVQNSRDPKVVRAILDAMKREGFQSVRIPVTWWGADEKTCKLQDAAFMTQLDNTIYYAISLGLIVVLNCHHEDWLNDRYTGAQGQNDIFWRHWRILAQRYQSVAQNELILQVLNEPHNCYGSEAHNTDPNSTECIRLTRLINKTGFDGVRSVDKTRIVAVMCNNMGNIHKCNTVYPSRETLPGSGNDKYLMFTCHSYDRFSFTGQNGSVLEYMSKVDPIGSLRSDIDKRLTMLKDWQTKMGGPTVVGVALTEIGVGRIKTSDLDHDLLREHLRYTATRARFHNFGVQCWSDVGWFRLFNLVNYVNGVPTVQWIYNLKDAFMNKSYVAPKSVITEADGTMCSTETDESK